MNNVIKRLTPSFRKIGIEITKDRGDRRIYILERAEIYPSYPTENKLKATQGVINPTDTTLTTVKSLKIPSASIFRGEV